MKEKVYDGSTTAQVRAGALEGVETGDEVCVSATAGYDSEDVGTGKKITVKYTIEGADKGNYLSPVDTEIMDGTITPKQSARLTDSKTRMVYKVTKFGTTSGTVQFVKTGNTTAQTVTIPDTVTINGITYQVTSISAEAFKGYKKLEKVTMGKNVTEIGASAFYGCTKLDTVSMGAKVATISDKAFYKCTALKAITIPATVNKIGKQAFYGCKKLKTVTSKLYVVN